MRRVAAAVIAGGCALAGIGFGVGHKAVIVDTSLTGAAAIPMTRPVAGPATKTVEFKGYQISVPARWPVYWLNQDPDQCVRYDVNAVYVGTPGANQNCPPGLIGRKDTISIGGPAASPGLPGPASAQAASSPAPGVDYQRALVKGRSAAGSSVAPGTIVQNPELREFAVAMPASAPSVNATYGTDPELVEQTLATMRQVRPQSASLGRAQGSARLASAAKLASPPPAQTWPWPIEPAP